MAKQNRPDSKRTGLDGGTRTRVIRPDNIRIKLSQAKSAKIVADAVRKHVESGGTLPPELDNALAVFAGCGSSWIGSINN